MRSNCVVILGADLHEFYVILLCPAIDKLSTYVVLSAYRCYSGLSTENRTEII